MSSSRTKLSLAERLGFLLNVFRTAFSALAALITSPLRGASGHRQLGKHVVHAALRRMNSIATARQLQNMSPSTDETYTELAKSKAFPVLSTHLPQGARAHWFGSQSAESVLVWCHGGGFVYPAVTHPEILWNLHQKSPNSAIVLLSYSLAPGKQYPHQLKQLVGLIEHLLLNGKRPENIILAGDSAGANLVLALFSHILHPHPAVDRLSPNGTFKAALLVSPWVSFDCTSDSYVINSTKDCLNRDVAQRWSSYYLGSAPADEYNQPLRAPADWWAGLNQLVAKLFVTAGTAETLFSDQEAFVEKLKTTYPMLETFFATEETHVQPFMDPMIGVKEKCESIKVFEEWLVHQLA